MNQLEFRHHGILGQKWGVRRYQNRDGTLTEAGKKRYDRDVKENNAKKKDNRIVIDGPDPKRWASEDLNRTKQVVDSGSELVKELKKIEQNTTPKTITQKLDLSKMSDKELRDRINRELLERQYNTLFAETSKAQVSKGREALKKTLDTAGTVLTLTGSALSIALAIKKLRD